MKATIAAIAAGIVFSLFAVSAGAFPWIGSASAEERGDSVVVSFRLTLVGAVPAGESFAGSYNGSETDAAVPLGFCGHVRNLPVKPLRDCVGGGATYTFQRLILKGSEIEYRYFRNLGEPGGKTFSPGRTTITQDATISATYTYRETPDEQRAGTATKTFELTLNGNVPEGQAFNVDYNPTGVDHAFILPLCGRGADTKCEGGGTVYTVTAEIDVGRRIAVRFVRVMTATEEAEIFLEYTEMLGSDTTNRAHYSFSNAAREDGRETPDQIPNTGAGGTAGGLPVRNTAAAAVFLIGAGGCAVRRLR